MVKKVYIEAGDNVKVYFMDNDVHDIFGCHAFYWDEEEYAYSIYHYNFVNFVVKSLTNCGVKFEHLKRYWSW